MYICFAEYRIMPEFIDQYLAEVTRLQQFEKRQVKLFEGTDQPGLFVEIWSAEHAEEAEQIKKERCDERSSWFELSQWIVGGPAKLHVWTFKPVVPNVTKDDQQD
ncbi:hypothetical protein I6N90_15400 [Paenibacillus sp. GSMTC-2017]|uniref:hypothetical protein n=1 Tax=Paenibacillus sp. GSMTC-2017 TaxID=2794350 RepID=UPI0018D71E95|nr:hypothetical protein [Paenibacillus sp. GSMTC-2017]MBH5319188.1 hypothetical protein [Paenibacillus sp. GSMTC-2017]